MITIEVDGIRYTHFKNVSISTTLEAIADQFSIVATAQETNNFPITQRAECRALIDNVPIVTGFIETLTVNYDVNSHQISITGSDKTVDVVDTTCADDMVFTGDITFKRFVELALKQAGVTGIQVIDAVGDIEPLKEADIQSSETGEPLFSFLERHARSRQILLSSNGDGNIELTRNSTQLINNYQLLNRKNDPNNTILSATLTLDDTQRFNRYIIKSQTAPNSFAALFSSQPASEMANKEAESVDDDIRESRILRLEAEKSSSVEQAQPRADYENNIRRIRSKPYSATVAGHVIPGTTTPFPVNRLIKVEDVLADLNETMLINSVTYNLSNNESTTTFGLVDQSAYSKEATKPVIQKRSSSSSADLIKALTGG